MASIRLCIKLAAATECEYELSAEIGYQSANKMVSMGNTAIKTGKCKQFL